MKDDGVKAKNFLSNMSMRYKLMMIVGLFVVPVCFLGYSYNKAANDLIAESQQAATAAVGDKVLVEKLNKQVASLESQKLTVDALVLAIVVLAFFGTFLVFRSITNPIRYLDNLQLSIGNGKLDNEVIDYGDDELGQLIKGLDNMQESLSRSLKETTRIKQALDSVTANVMIADTDNTIFYMNGSVTELLEIAEADLQKELQGFAVKKVLGSSVDIFHKNPQHQKNILSNLTGTHKAQIVVGGRTFSLILNPIKDDNGARLGTVVEWQDLTDQLAAEEIARQQATQTLRIKSALDKAATNVMMADENLNIMYMNEAVTNLLREAESDIRKDLPNFSVDKAIGSNIDIFHKNPAHQRAMLAKLTTTHSAQIQVGGRTFSLTVTPVVNEIGERLGTAVEWVDMTKQLAIENEIREVIEAITHGNLTSNIDLTGKTGFLRNLSEGVNLIVKTVNNALIEIQSAVQRVADGKLDRDIEHSAQGTFGQVLDDVQTAIERLRDIVTKINESSDLVQTASAELAAGNEDMSRRTESQASSLEETASSMEELTSTVKQNSDNAQQANQLAVNARSSAEEGGKVVSDAISAMKEISDASGRIAEIIGVIDEIAFQTNLLALNASVEAARAGEQGRGFAVVASEVRNLAQRSASAAKEIRELIQDSLSKVDGGSKLVSKSGETLTQIVEGVKKVGDIIAEIAAASREQTSGIEQVNQALVQMDDITQRNAALAEEASANSENLSAQAAVMAEQMGFFELSRGGARAVAKAPAAAAQSKPKSDSPAPAKPKPAAKAASKPAASKIALDDDDSEEWIEF